MADRAAADNQQSNERRAAHATEQAPQTDAALSAVTRALVLPGSVSDLPASIRRRPALILSLQRSVGNAAVIRLLRETEREIQRDDDDDLAAAPELEGAPEPEPESGPQSESEPAESPPNELPPEETAVTEDQITDDEGTVEADPSTDGGEAIDDEGTDETTPDSEGGEAIDDEGTDVEEEDGPSLSLPFSLDTLIVDDSAELEEGQLTKSSFLSQLRASVTPQATNILTEAGSTSDVNAGVDFWFSKVSGLSGPVLQRAINAYAPSTLQAETAAAMIPIVSSRLLGPIRTWAKTGELAGLPEIPGIGVPLFDPGALRKSAGSASPATVDPLVLRARLGPGEPITGDSGSAMAAAFGQNFDDVRIHRDGIAASLASGLDARAFTVGSHIAFAAGEHQPGTLVGDALMAHELAHVAQQRLGAARGVQTRGSGDESAFEADADRTAISVMAALHGGRAGLTAWAKTLGPNLKSGLRLQRCSSKDEKKAVAPVGPVPTAEEVGKHAAAMNALLGDPTGNADAIKAKISEMGPYGGHILLKVLMLTNRAQMTTIAGTARGPEILKLLIDSLQNGDYAAFASFLHPNGEDPNNVIERDRGRSIAISLDQILKKFGEDPVKMDADTTAELARVNAAIGADGRMAEYKAAGVKFPVKIFNPGTEVDGGLYYDPALEVEGATTAVPLNKSDRRPVLIYIRLSRKALLEKDGIARSDAFLRSAMFHEFTHYQQYLDFRNKDLDSDARTEQLRLEDGLENAGGEAGPSADVEAITAQLVHDIATIIDDAEVRGLLRYLSTKWNFAFPDFRDRAVAAMKNPAHPLGAKDGVQMQRMLRLIKSMGLHAGPKKKPPKGTPPNKDLESLFKALSS